MASILIPLPSTDFDPTEAGVPWRILTRVGHTVRFATPDGAQAAADPIMVTGKGLGLLADPRDFMAGPLALKRDSDAHLAPGFFVRDGNYLSARWPGDAHRFAAKFGTMPAWRRRHTIKLIVINLLAMAGLPRMKDEMIVLLSNRHLALEKHQNQLIYGAAQARQETALNLLSA